MSETAFDLIAFCITTMSFLLGLVVIMLFWKDKTALLIGFYSVKPFIIHGIGIFLIMQLFYQNYGEFAKLIEVKKYGCISYLTSEIIFSVAIIYFFHDLLGKQKVLILLPLLDAIQWVAFAMIDFYFYLSNFSVAPYRVVWLFVYPVIAFGVGSIRAKSKQSASLSHICE